MGRFVQPALIGGAMTGVLSALPFVSAGNLCCCLWVVSGGVAAAYMLQQNDSQPITAGDGALAGLAAGVVGALIYLLLSIPITILVSPLERAILERLSRTAEGMPPELREYLNGPLGTGVRIVMGFVMMLLVAPIFSTLGGVLGTAIFRKARPVPSQAPQASDPSPSSPAHD